MQKNTKLSLHITCITFIVIFLSLWFLIFISWYFLKDYFWKLFIQWIENQTYLIDYNDWKINTLEELEKIYEEDWYFFEPENSYFIKNNNATITKVGLTNLFETDLDFLSTLNNGEYISYTISKREYFLYNDTYTNKIYVTNFFVKEIQAVLYEVVVYFLLIILLPLYILIKKFVKLHFKPIEESNDKLKKYNHNLAHEIKNPLSSILINLEILKINFHKELLDNIETETKTINNITDTLLGFAEKTKIKNLDYYNLWDLLNNFNNWLNSDDQKSFLLQDNFDIKIKTDANLFNIILKNVFENGLKYSSDQKVNIYRIDNKLVFKNKVKEDIPKEELNKLLNFFYRYKALETKWFGLWLGIVTSICDELNYSIHLDSKNKVFIFELKFK